MTAEPYYPIPAPGARTGAIVGMYCQACGRPAPCPTHPKAKP